VPWTLATVLLDRMPLAAPATPPVADVVAIAKRDLAPGERLDGIGGYCCYGHADTVERGAGLLPIGLAEHATVRAAVRADDPVPLEAVELDEDAPVVRLRREQDALVGAV
jgi:predicted homoserine dehydrogenase-like protein